MNVIVVDELVVSNEDGKIDTHIAPFSLESSPFVAHQNVTFHVFQNPLANLFQSSRKMVFLICVDYSQ